MFRSIDAQYLGFQENPFVLDPRQRCDGGMTTGAKTQQESTLRPHAIAGIGIVNDGEQVANRRIFRQRLYPHRSLRRGRQHDIERNVMTGFSITQRSEEHTSELQSLMRISYAVFCLKKKTKNNKRTNNNRTNSKTMRITTET